jgi:16S rRNA (cytidine1402-2'-O)-methyltransferase
VGTLYVVSAPAGNPDDLTRRALRILEQVSLIVADDQDSARTLLDHFGITTTFVPAPGYDHLDTLAEGNVAYLCPGLSPSLSESASRLIRGALERRYPVVPAPGPSFPITALVISGLPADSFVFLGELPHEPTARSELLAAVSFEPRTVLALAPGTLLPAALADLHSTLGDRPLVLVASSTVGAQVVWRGRVEGAAGGLGEAALPGTYVLVIGGAPAGTARWDEDRLRSEIQSLQVAGLGAKQISQRLAGDSGWSRREVYGLSVELGQGDRVQGGEPDAS